MAVIRFFAASLLRGGLLKAIGVLLLLSLIVAFVLSDVDIGDKNKLFYDLILVAESFWLYAIALLWGYELSKNEQLLKLARIPLSTTLSRRSYETGRFAAMALSFAPLALLLAVLTLALATPLVAWQFILYAVSALLVGFLVLTLSRFFAPVSAVLYAAALLMIGNGLDELYLYGKLSNASQSVRVIGEVLFVILPNFSLFDHQGEAVSGIIDTVFGFFGLPILYALALMSALLALSIWRFKKAAI
ncbi:MAG: hypothetical protein LBN32_00705 [Helicobacteraceae bacterium]|jgi:hypothetical protein|nr:hypothetical protein [Helicobacteraceae bacterium]